MLEQIDPLYCSKRKFWEKLLINTIWIYICLVGVLKWKQENQVSASKLLEDKSDNIKMPNEFFGKGLQKNV